MSPAPGHAAPLDSLAKLRVLVTGANGFIGSHLCRALVAQGASVWAASRHKPADIGEVTERVELDATDLEGLRALFARARPDIVYHLAGHVTGAPQLEQVIPTFRSNLVTSVHMMTCCAEAGCQRVIMAASLEEPEIGDALPRLGSPYAAAKWAARAYGRMFHDLYRLPIVQGRVFVAYGPGQSGSGKLIPYTIETLLAGEQPRFGSGERRMDWVYIDDVTHGLMTLALAPGVEGTTVDIGSGLLVSVRDVVREIFALLERPEAPAFGALTPRPEEVVRVADVARTDSLMAWRARVSLREGLQRTIEWHRASAAAKAGARIR